MRTIDFKICLPRASPVVLVIFGIILCLSQSSFAQNGSGSVYSMFGIGELNPTTSVQSRGMGYASIGLSSKYDVNIINPAANDQLGQSFNHATNIGFYYASTGYETERSDTELGSYGGLSNFSFWFRIGKRFNSLVGLNQYSNVGYNIYGDTGSIANGSYQSYYQGSGGLNEFYLSNGLTIIDNLSLGVKLAFIFGNINHTETAYSSTGSQQFFINDEVHIRDLYAEYSLNYRIVQSKFDLNFGILFKDQNTLVGNTLSQTVMIDPTSGESDLLSEEVEYTQDYDLPRKYGFGFSLNTNKFILAGDIEYEQWSQVSLQSYEEDLNDTWKYAIGLEFTPDRFESSYAKRMSYRIGGYMQNSYLNIDDTSFNKVGFTGGLSLPLRNGSAINLAYQRKFNGTLENDLIYESTHEVSFNLSIRNRWFQKRKYN